jgi:hypothetical protein
MHVLPNGHAIYCAWNTDNGEPLLSLCPHIKPLMRTAWGEITVQLTPFVDAGGPQKLSSVQGTFRNLRHKYPQVCKQAFPVDTPTNLAVYP